ncbi:Octicosapeptide/Phox/Bem1p (PB1) domain-containing protein / tetratricopeptide repeat (TPR)-containing protein [Arabidopsis thaliana]|jgi:tetratricopeptide (TPR) repeat protein|uniref:Octicosapeptide/Phox/Bem1p (PB1) domain-containing protein / tetratricopeptide repeat (TPR)-containing protein n=1 Tax=Arabidopsis thaliana TaxID=3702 RepID=A0A1R7T3E1_ARATH|nr:Octicosapeptide/Phox/Bem1p (PB1) domain-containing protein / tetratricopeptide repeat (TPR)-containing protein [Arabidopsis thaliana]ANM71140.1 Octicosapeptide/Phox/Bem1p (PB1) domain-containing protein / tetratricopeptide repeat (TPR)-containing protein [Arabidopsis thaliana]|eukprot:NP_001332689.1 Octicosapeptide/Phox/Bem1p (PB1) domain-containing protein / tetratricopeptide repeat (TPR)-containing protein [Arabidopsis thaliana]
MEKQNEEISTDDAETSQSQLVDDSKVETLDDCVSKVETLDDCVSKVETLDDCVSKAETLADCVSKVETLDDCVSKVKTLDDCVSKVENLDDCVPKVETLDDCVSEVETLDDCVSKAQGLKEEGNKLFQKRDYDGAMFKYGEAIKILPKDHVEVSHVRANVASCYMQLEPGEFAKAIHECDLALSVTPDHNKALLKRARCYEALNKLDLALRDVCMVSKLDPKNPMASEIVEKLKRTLESKGLRINNSVIELPPDYVEPVGASPAALWAKLGKVRVKKTKKSNQVEEKSEGEGEDVEPEKKNNVLAEKGKEKIKMKVKGKQSDKRSDTSKEQEKVIIEEELLVIGVEDVNKDVKFVYSDDIRLAELPINCTLFKLREVVHERFPSLRAVHIKYRDQEGDLVTITTDEELRMSEVSSRSQGTMRFYVVEVSPEQDPFFGRLVEMKKLKITADSFKAKVNGRGGCKVEDWMIEFAHLFKIQARIDSDRCLNLQELGMKLNSEAMEEVVTSDAAQGPFDRAAQQFQEVAARSLLNLGYVHMSGARKRLSLLQGVSGESVSEQVKTAYECAKKEHANAKEKYEEAMKIKPECFEVFLALGLQQFEEARLSWYYVLVSHLDLKTWPYADVVQFYQSAESNIKKSMEVLENLETGKESEPSQAGKTDCLTHEKDLGSSTQNNPAKEAGRLKSWIDILLCAVLYERSIMEYKLDQPFWRESLEAAMEKFELAGTCKDDVVEIISEDYVAGNTLRDIRFHMEEIIQIFDEIYEAKHWTNGIPSDQLEEILKRRAENIFHVPNIAIQRG